MAAATNLDEIEEVNANCILMANLQQSSTSGTQADKALVYDSNGSAKLSKEKSTVSSLLKEKKWLKSDFKIREDELLDKQIQLENKIKELDNRVTLEILEVHISRYGFDQHYTTWKYHGEPILSLPPPVPHSPEQVNPSTNVEEVLSSDDSDDDNRS
ncbi:hypothetical protein Tco_1486370 [Tanacetum coccineum]